MCEKRGKEKEKRDSVVYFGSSTGIIFLLNEWLNDKFLMLTLPKVKSLMFSILS